MGINVRVAGMIICILGIIGMTPLNRVTSTLASPQLPSVQVNSLEPEVRAVNDLDGLPMLQVFDTAGKGLLNAQSFPLWAEALD
ncbi:MAG: hypothetical protein HC933_03685 [Pleurocapsa sp. SU_196_0]|nr:hypothetical protein [Pleurocapsa sp. SU_196_0]